MNPRRVRLVPSFEAAFRKLPRELQNATREAILAFCERNRAHALRPELLKGLVGIWSFRVDRGLRVFYPQERDADGRVHVLFHVGPHDDYRTIARKGR